MSGRKPSCRCGVCKRCLRNAQKKRDYRALDVEGRRARVARRNKISVYINQTRGSIRHDKRHPQRAKARDAVQRALAAGTLTRRPCEKCGAEHDPPRVIVQGHHDDYSRPLDVRWLCTECHANHHKEN